MVKIKSLFKKDSGRLAKKSGLTFIIKMGGMGVAYLLTLLITKGGGSGAWGSYAMAYAILQICATIAQFGIDTASIRFVSQFQSRNEQGKMKDFYIRAVVMVFFTSIIISGISYLLSPYLGTYVFHKDYLVEYFQLVALGILPQTFIDLHAEMFKGLKKPALFAFFMYVSTYLVTSIIILLNYWVNDTKIDGFSAFKYTVIALWVIVVFAVVLWHIQVKFYKYIREKALTNLEILKVSGPMMITMSIVLIMGWTDTLMLGSLMDNTESVGVYNVALKLSTMIGLALMAVNSVSTPKYAEFYARNEMDKLSSIVRQSTKLVFWISLPMCILCMILPGWILSFFGNEFRAGAVSLVLLSIGRFTSSICGSVGYLLQMTGHEKIIQNIMFFACILNIILNYLLIPVLGIDGSALATMISTITWNLIAVYYIKKKLNLTTLYLPYLSNR